MSEVTFCHNRKDLKTEGSSKAWKMKSGKWCGVEKMKTGSMVKCSTLKEAELIPDSAVPYTLPESRCNSSNHQTSKFESGRDLTHLTTCVRQRTLKKRPKTSRSVREVEPQLVSQREELAAYIFVCVCAVSVVASDWREGKTVRVSVNAVSTASKLSAEQSNPAVR